jgi:hypothetical protein
LKGHDFSRAAEQNVDSALAPEGCFFRITDFASDSFQLIVCGLASEPAVMSCRVDRIAEEEQYRRNEKDCSHDVFDHGPRLDELNELRFQ